jgi:hypothetical protein
MRQMMECGSVAQPRFGCIPAHDPLRSDTFHPEVASVAVLLLCSMMTRGHLPSPRRLVLVLNFGSKKNETLENWWLHCGSVPHLSTRTPPPLLRTSAPASASAASSTPPPPTPTPPPPYHPPHTRNATLHHWPLLAGILLSLRPYCFTNNKPAAQLKRRSSSVSSHLSSLSTQTSTSPGAASNG